MTIPNKFNNGELADAPLINENFEYLDNSILDVLNVANTSTFTKYDETKEYAKDEIVTIVDEKGKLRAYISLKDHNKGNALTNEEFWKKTSVGGGGEGLAIGEVGIAIFDIEEAKNLKRYLNGQTIIQSQFKKFTEKLKATKLTNPNLFCTNEEFETELTMSAFNQCGKFVINDVSGTIRLPKVVTMRGVIDLQNAGLRVEAGLPNITGTVTSDYAEHFKGAFYNGGSVKGNGGGGTDALALFDASRSSKVYGKSTTVQEEAIQYPYYIVVATGEEEEDRVINTYELNNPYTLFDCKFTEAKLFNISWLSANEGTFHAKSTYPKAYEALLLEHNPDAEIGTVLNKYTKRGLSVKLKGESYTDYDFVLDTANTTFRLPIKTKLASGCQVVGNGKVISVTNGKVDACLQDTSSYGASFDNNTQGNNTLPYSKKYDHGFVNGDYVGLTTDPTKSGIETSNDGLYLYFYVGETVQNANLIDAGRIEEALVQKTDKVQASHFSKPGNKVINLNWSVSSRPPFVAPADGFVDVRGGSDNAFIGMKVLDKQGRQIYGGRQYDNTWSECYVILPVQKGYTVADWCERTLKHITAQFIYSEGSI